jgi:Metallo-peptidase family M12B Reprolysin-like
MKQNCSLLLLLLSCFISAQLKSQALWQPAAREGEYTLSGTEMEQLLRQAPHERNRHRDDMTTAIELVGPDGSLQTFSVWQVPVMATGLARQFPAIATYAGISSDGRSTLRCDLSPRGFRAMVMSPAGTWFVEPRETATYEVFWKKDKSPAHSFTCHGADDRAVEDHGQPRAPFPIGDELRNYRLAVSATAEYTQYHGGTVEGAMAAIVTTMNRVNGIYERDLSIRMLLVDSNQLLIFTDAATDPFSGSDGQIMNQNQAAVDSRIGNANYDIGHVFHVGGGGVANLRAVCNNTRKARGFTSGNPPQGDFFDVDYVAHELGHQFGANHTMNNCQNSNAATAFEPGSGTSIMGYAGLCGNNNVATNSDDLFHVISLEEITTYAFFGGGNNCPVMDSTFNSPPVIAELPPDGLFLPISTPFELEVGAFDIDEDSLTFSWEQYNLGPVSTLGNPTGSAPSFRIFRPSESPVRVFPRLENILSNTSTNTEVLPTYERELTFRIVVRDNNTPGGGVSWEEVTLNSTEEAGPFVVLTANQPATWFAGSFQRIDWEVAGTDQAPVGVDSIDISLSTPGGLSYPYILATVANTGTAIISIPDSLTGENYRIKLKGQGHVFFDINNSPLTLEAAPAPVLAITLSPEEVYICAGDEARYELYFAALGGLIDSLQLSVLDVPAGISLNLPEQPLGLPAVWEVNVGATGELATGDYSLRLLSATATTQDTIQLLLRVQNGLPEPPALLLPENGAADVSIRTPLEWDGGQAEMSYTLEVATDSLFTDLVFSASGLTGSAFTSPTDLADSTRYFWRVRTDSPVCGAGNFSVVSSFVTERIECRTYTTTLLPVPFSSLPFIISRIEVAEDFIIRDININNIRGNYSGELGELGFRVNGPGIPYYTLVPDYACGLTGDFNFSIDDEAPAAGFPCPLTDSVRVRPAVPLTNYEGINARGNWRLYLYDGGSAGQLTNWEIELCGPVQTISAVTDEGNAPGGLKLYPQPSADVVYFESPEQAAGMIELFAADGRLLNQLQLADRQGISFANYPVGCYFYRWRSADGRKVDVGKIVISR